MTIKLLQAWNGYAAGSILNTGDRATEAALVAQFIATYDTTGGVVPPRDQFSSKDLQIVPDGSPVSGGAAVGGYRFVTIIDSLSFNGTSDGATTQYDMARGCFQWLQVYMAGRMRLQANLGVSGTTTQQWLDNGWVESKILSLSPLPHWVLMLGPVNDVRLGLPSATTQANITTIYSKLKAAGISLALSTTPMFSDVTTNAQKDVLRQNNAWIKEFCAKNSLPCPDLWAVTSNADDGTLLSARTYDGIGHWSDMGAAWAGRAWWEVFSEVIPERDTSGGMPSDFDCAIWNHNFRGSGVAAPASTGGQIAGLSGYRAGAAGWVSNWSTPTAPTIAKSTRPIGDGTTNAPWRSTNSLQITSAAASAQGQYTDVQHISYIGQAWVASTAAFVAGDLCLIGGNLHLCTTAGTTGSAAPASASAVGGTVVDGTVTWTRINNFAAGDSIYAEVEVTFTSISGGNGGVTPTLICQHIGSSFTNAAAQAVSDQATACAQLAGMVNRTLLLRTRPWTLPAGATKINTYVRFYQDNGTSFVAHVSRPRICHFTGW